MIKKSLYFMLCVAGLLIIAFLFQPIKKGKGLGPTVNYEPVKNWPALQKELKLGNPTGISMDTSEHVVVFHRADRKWPLLGSMPDKRIQSKTILIIDKDTGKLINSWGDNLFIMPHGLAVDFENNVWVTDVGLHQVFKFSLDGKLLMKLGEAFVTGSDSLHFNKPTDVAIAKDGSFYVSDGYENSRIVKFSATGKYLFEWGRKGNGEGEFNIPHAITLDSKNNVYVADRENNRVQMFDINGRFIKQFADNTLAAMCSVAFDKKHSQLFAVDDFTFLKLKHRGSDVFVFDTTGNLQIRFGRSGFYKGSTTWYHDLTIDKAGNIYICDILGNRIQKFKKTVRR